VYGADIDIKQKIGVENFTEIIDDKSWIEFMPKGITKDLFKEFGKYFDNEVFVEAGLKIRRQAKAADELPPLERVQAIADIFSTFKNPDRETVLTPWRAVNLHMGVTIGGASFFEDDFETPIKINDDNTIRWIVRSNLTNDIFNTQSNILEINSKSGLYPLYAAISIFQDVRNKGQMKNVEHLWTDILNNNIYVICRTKMAAAITRRTLNGFKDIKGFKTKVIVMDDLVSQMSSQYESNYANLVKHIKSKKTWHIGSDIVKFDAVIGNPPYQSDAKQQIYTDFYLLAREIGEVVSLIFPVGWQEPKNANNLSKLNNEIIKRDPQIIFIDNRQNVFPGISGAEWTNFVLWKKGHDNKLEGKQLIYTNGDDEDEVLLPINKEDIEKPKELEELKELIFNNSSIVNIVDEVSSLKPYGLRTDFLDNPSKYNLPPFKTISDKEDDIKIFGLINRRQSEVFVSQDYPLPNKTDSINNYKVFVGKAWGNWSNNYLGGAYSDVILGKPLEICTENFLEIGNYTKKEEAYLMAKYLMTRFLRGLLYLNKFSQDNSKDKFKYVPKQDFSENWWGESIEQLENRLFDKYNVPQNIRDFVLNNIQQKSEENILNI